MAKATVNQCRKLQKAFDSAQRDSSWRILRAYDIPQQFVQTSEASAKKKITCCVGNGNVSFDVKTQVTLGCVLLALLFNWMMHRTTENQRRGIRWSLLYTFEDVDCTDDLALLHSHMQDMHIYTPTWAKYQPKKKTMNSCSSNTTCRHTLS